MGGPIRLKLIESERSSRMSEAVGPASSALLPWRIPAVRKARRASSVFMPLLQQHQDALFSMPNHLYAHEAAQARLHAQCPSYLL